MRNFIPLRWPSTSHSEIIKRRATASICHERREKERKERRTVGGQTPVSSLPQHLHSPRTTPRNPAVNDGKNDDREWVKAYRQVSPPPRHLHSPPPEPLPFPFRTPHHAINNGKKTTAMTLSPSFGAREQVSPSSPLTTSRTTPRTSTCPPHTHPQ